MNDAINYVAMVLSVVSLVVTIVGFFASLKFYRDGVELQGKANDALTKLAEKTDFIQSQVGGMFDKTLDAAIGKRYELSIGFEDLEKQLSDAKEALLGEVREQIGEAGEQQQLRIKQTVEEQIRLLREKVEVTRESAEEIADRSFVPAHGIAQSKLAILRTLNSVGDQLSTSDLGQHIRLINPAWHTRTLARRLRELMMTGFIMQIEEEGSVKYQMTDMGKKFLDSYEKSTRTSP